MDKDNATIEDVRRVNTLGDELQELKDFLEFIENTSDVCKEYTSIIFTKEIIKKISILGFTHSTNDAKNLYLPKSFITLLIPLLRQEIDRRTKELKEILGINNE